MGRLSGPGLGSNQESVRRHNLGTLLRHVHEAGHLSRADLTASMALNRSTIAGLVGQLDDLGITEQVLPVAGRNGAGRPSAGVAIAPHGPYVVAVDLGVDRTTVATVGLGGRVLSRTTAQIRDGGESWQVGADVAEMIRAVVADVRAESPLVGIGIGVPGLVRRTDGLVRLAPNLDWHDVSFGGIVLAALGLDVPISVSNDADIGALAESRRGVGVGIDDLIYLSGNVGVGAGVISGGRRFEGTSGYAGEIGHLTVDPRGRDCHCGNKGCWETVVGAPAIARGLGLAADLVPQLDEVLDGYTEAPDALRPTATALGQGLANLVNAFNPRLVVLGGYFRALYRLCRDDVDAGLAERALPAPFESVSLTQPGLGTDSVLLGAAEMALEPLFADPEATVGAAVLDVRTALTV